MSWFFFLPRKEDFTLLLGDCLERMKEIPDGSVDMVLCDMPYGMTQNKWDTVIPFEPLWEAYHRVCKPNAAIVLNCMQPFTSALVMSNQKEFKYLWYWDKHLKTGFLNAKKQPLRQVEEIAVFYRRQCRFIPPKKAEEAIRKTSRRKWVARIMANTKPGKSPSQTAIVQPP